MLAVSKKKFEMLMLVYLFLALLLSFAALA